MEGGGGRGRRGKRGREGWREGGKLFSVSKNVCLVASLSSHIVFDDVHK